MKKLTLLVLFAIGIASLLTGCLPAEPPYPYKPASELEAYAQQLSNDLEAYIKDWAAGRVSEKLPENLIPSGVNRTWFPDVYVKNPASIPIEKKWGVRKEQKAINFNALVGLFPDPHCTYAMPFLYYAPFGSKIVIKGQFPYSRFFSIQVSPPYDGRFYYVIGGVGEVALVDKDINPDSGSINPFRNGANRMATNRNYTITFINAKGDAIALNNGAHTKPYYVGAGNTRYGGAIQYGGPWCDPNYYNTTSPKAGFTEYKGPWLSGDIWLRYYGIDKNKDWTAGVPLPDYYHELPTGQRFIIWSDPAIVQADRDRTHPVRTEAGADPQSYHGATVGWGKQYGIFNAVMAGLMITSGLTDEGTKAYGRRLVLGVTSTGESQPGIGSMEPTTTASNHINYLLRGMAINTGKVAVIAGKLPTFPSTRNGEATMGTGQMRYFSFTTYDPSSDANVVPGACAITSIMDDEIVLDSTTTRQYVICYSRAVDKPNNATSAAKVTWKDWGPTTTQSFTLRWLSVYPDWTFAKQPHELNCTWEKTAWGACTFDPNILYSNNRAGFLAEYQPVMYYMTKASFESLGTPVTEAKLKTISWGCGSTIAQGSNGYLLILLPLGLIMLANGIWIMRKRKK